MHSHRALSCVLFICWITVAHSLECSSAIGVFNSEGNTCSQFAQGAVGSLYTSCATAGVCHTCCQQCSGAQGCDLTTAQYSCPAGYEGGPCGSYAGRLEQPDGLDYCSYYSKTYQHPQAGLGGLYEDCSTFGVCHICCKECAGSFGCGGINLCSACPESGCPCAKGTTGPNGGPCVQCEAGKYKSVTGSSACISSTNCDSYSSSLLAGAISDTHCTCKAGFYSTNGMAPCTGCRNAGGLNEKCAQVL